MGKTSIEWTQETWNPVTGCDKVSQGCKVSRPTTMNKSTSTAATGQDIEAIKDLVKSNHPANINLAFELAKSLDIDLWPHFSHYEEAIESMLLYSEVEIYQQGSLRLTGVERCEEAYNFTMETKCVTINANTNPSMLPLFVNLEQILDGQVYLDGSTAECIIENCLKLDKLREVKLITGFGAAYELHYSEMVNRLRAKGVDVKFLPY